MVTNRSGNRDRACATPVVDKEGFIYVHARDVPTLRKMDGETGQYVRVHRLVDESGGTTSPPTLSHDQKTIYIGRTARGIAYLVAINVDHGTFKRAWSPEISKRR